MEVWEKGSTMGASMINVLVADDEKRICQLICVLGRWSDYGMSVTGTASNGNEALEFIRRNHVDVLITDIRMPGCDGLELISRVQKLNPGIRIVIVSGYANFEYAQTAIQMNVREYLLKPINADELNHTLEKISREIQNEREDNRSMDDFRKEHAQDISFLREQIIFDLKSGTENDFTDEKLRSRYHFDCGRGITQIAAIKADIPDNEGGEEIRSALSQKMKDVFSSLLEPVCRDMTVAVIRTTLYCLMNFEPEVRSEVRRRIWDGINEMQASSQLYGLAKFTAGLGSEINRTDHLPDAFLTAENAVFEKITGGGGKIYEYRTDRPAPDGKSMLGRFGSAAGEAVSNLSYEILKKASDTLRADIKVQSYRPGWWVLQMAADAGDLFLMHFDFGNQDKVSENLHIQLENSQSIDQLFDCLNEFMKSQMSVLIFERENDTNRPIRQAKSYIAAHYSEPLTLEQVSEAVQLNPAYFSVLFKKKTGTGFAKYLMSYRIDKARELLRDTNLSVAEICAKVGYNDIRTFRKNFENICGVKPALYRKLYG